MYIEEKINTLLEQQKQLLERVELFLPNLEKEKGVIHFLEITKNTFNTYIKDGIFIEGQHYVKEGTTKVFIANAIIELKKSGVKGKRKKSTKQDTLDAVNLQLGIIPECRSAI